MKILIIIPNYLGTLPFIPELCSRFRNDLNLTVSLLNLENISLINVDGSIYKALVGSKISQAIQYDPNSDSGILRKKTNKIFFKLITPIWKFVKNRYILPREISKLCEEFDVFNIHYVQESNYWFHNIIKRKARFSVLTLWGSDINKSSLSSRMLSVLNSCDLIVTSNFNMISSIKDRTSLDLKSKYRYVAFGTEKFINLHSIISQENRDLQKKLLGLNETDFIVTLGYNARPSQNHFLIIDKLSQLSDEIKRNIILVLPMTYPELPLDYTTSLISSLEEKKFNYEIYSETMSDDDVLRLRNITDIVINFQSDDGFSLSLREHLFCGNVLILADWLDYSFLKEKGVYFISSSLEDLCGSFLDAYSRFNEHKIKTYQNNEILHETLSWEINILHWEKVFSELENLMG